MTTHAPLGLPVTYGQFTVTMAPEAPLDVPPYAGGMFRGAFGIALQRVVCVTRTHDCPPCLLKDRCIFPYVFDTAPPAATTVMRKYTSAPHPFVLEPPRGGTTVTQGEPIRVGLTLFGRALQYVPHFVFAFERLGMTGLGRNRIRCRLSQVESTLDGVTWALYSAEDRALRGSEPFHASMVLSLGAPSPAEASASTERVTLEFVTPARMVYQERLARTPEFHIVVRNLLRRVAHLSYFHCGGDPSVVAFREWIAGAAKVRLVSRDLRWYDWERFSGRQRTRMTLGGLVGRATFEGSLGRFLPLLRLGEITHVGKGTSFGLGQYRLLKVEEGSS
jgi:hypothetical protein